MLDDLLEDLLNMLRQLQHDIKCKKMLLKAVEDFLAITAPSSEK